MLKLLHHPVCDVPALWHGLSPFIMAESGKRILGFSERESIFVWK